MSTTPLRLGLDEANSAGWASDRLDVDVAFDLLDIFSSTFVSWWPLRREIEPWGDL